MYKSSLLFLLLFFSTPVISDEADKLAEQASGLSQTFGAQLKQQLQQGMQAGGPVTALDICNLQAPAIAKIQEQASGWSVGRTSMKARQESNRPDTWELLTMLDFEKQKAAGVDLAGMENYAVVESEGSQVFRYMKAIPTAGVCLDCHGENIKPEILAKVDQLYPVDQARGFKLGDIRGAFTLSKKLD